MNSESGASLGGNIVSSIKQFIEDLRDEFAASRVENRLDALRAEEESMKRHITNMRRKYLAIVEERQALEAQILQGVRL